jgi:hypothetical protein
MTIHYESRFSGDPRDAAFPAPSFDAGAGADVAYGRPGVEANCSPAMRWPLDSGLIAFFTGFFAAQPPFERIVVDLADQEVTGGRRRDSSL